MDSKRNAKRPRSNTPPSKGGSETRKKKGTKKKGKKKKTDDSTIASGAPEESKQKHHHHHHHKAKETATADGNMMAQMVSTFSSLEASRFQAFKRACLNADAVENWVAACLQDRFGENCSSSSSRPLADLVAHGQAQEIGLVVGMAAKIYAQRLTAEAVAVQQARGVLPEGSALEVGAVVAAHAERQRRGLDPGFFMQPAEDTFNWAADSASLEHYDTRRLAALAAQDEYDKRVKEQEEEASTMQVDNDTPSSPAKDEQGGNSTETEDELKPSSTANAKAT